MEEDMFLCSKCEHYVERIIIPNCPEAAEMLGFDPDEYEDENYEPVGHLTCLILGLDLGGYDVLECNKFKPKKGRLWPSEDIDLTRVS